MSASVQFTLYAVNPSDPNGSTTSTSSAGSGDVDFPAIVNYVNVSAYIESTITKDDLYRGYKITNLTTS